MFKPQPDVVARMVAKRDGNTFSEFNGNTGVPLIRKHLMGESLNVTMVISYVNSPMDAMLVASHF